MYQNVLQYHVERKQTSAGMGDMRRTGRNRKVKKKGQIKRILAALLAGVMAAGLAACGSSNDKKGETGSDSTFVYQPEWKTMGAAEDTWCSNFSVAGSRMYYQQSTWKETESSQDYRYLDLNNPDAEPVVVYQLSNGEEPLDTEGEPQYSAYVSQIFAAEDGSIIMVEAKQPVIDYGNAADADWERQQRDTLYTLKKVAADGTEVFSKDITEQIHLSEDMYFSYAAADKDGNLYFSNGNSDVWVFDRDGGFIALVALDSNSQYGAYVNGMGVLGDGRVAILQHAGNGLELKVYNADKRAFSDTYGSLPPNCWNSSITPGLNGGVLLNGQDMLYEYDPETQTYSEIVKWMDCDMNGDYVEFAAALEDGTIAVYYNDWNSDEESLVLLKKTAASEVVQKEVITLGCLYLSQSLQASVVAFNKSNENYKIEVKDYTSSIDWSQENASDSYQDAINQFNSDIITGSGPDLFVADSVDMEQLAVKGVIEDLAPYLENSTVTKREDLIEPVLNAYTIDGTLCTIPVTFSVATLVGRTAEVGEESGWTMDDMLALAAQYPDAAIFNSATRDTLLMYCLMFDFDSYVDWESGECHFDSPEFKKVLEFAASYPEELDWQNQPSEPKALRTHEALLSVMSLDEPQSWQVTQRMFEEPITAIGYPSAGSTGVMVSGTDGVCINAGSKNKEAAWSFIEFQLDEKNFSSRMLWGFPIIKSLYDEQMEEAMKADYQLDENGNIMLDENGNPVEISHSSYGWGDDIEIEVYSVTQEEADNIWKVISRIGGVMSYNEQLMNIVTEEAAPYFEGQKSVDEVADIIQSRVKIYVNENR